MSIKRKSLRWWCLGDERVSPSCRPSRGSRGTSTRGDAGGRLRPAPLLATGWPSEMKTKWQEGASATRTSAFDRPGQACFFAER
ncbi:hypothetical protein BRADI_4g14279v3 [Brachypodium distachyon]|uniref:Uncharacterized protein n=1 Tax=Brachypodium distachyon TaxID=15368 RepID=A0A0Q3H3C8_BRADI|nr:hypothetical protein BRADI_4g14279v3 [Brachypodium distachyon]